MFRLLFVFLFTGNVIFAQTQVGVDINGEAASDGFGYAVATNQNGSVIVVGGRRNDGNGADAGHVRVFRNISGTWTQWGVDVNGDAADDQFGSAVAINSAGNTIVVGSPLHTATNNGRVKVLTNTTGNWTLVGAPIDGWGNNAAAGMSVAISSNGSIIAIGAPTFSTGATNRGGARVYQNVSGTWTQIGGTIQGGGVEYRLGASVALSSDGSVLAVGMTGNGTSGFPGRVQVYRNVSGVWTQIGTDLIGAANGDAFGQGLSLSSDGNTVAIGAPLHSSLGLWRGQVKVYSNIAGTWTQVGATLSGEANESQAGSSLSLSGDGTILAVGSPGNTNANGTYAGNTRIYKNISGTWTQLGVDIDGEATNDVSGSSVSISNDGNYVTIGAPQNDGNGTDSGHTRVYNLTPLLSTSNWEGKLAFSIYPNPANDFVTIEVANKLEYVEIYSAQGELIHQGKDNEIQLSNFPNGIYLVKVQTSNGEFGIQKLIKK